MSRMTSALTRAFGRRQRFAGTAEQATQQALEDAGGGGAAYRYLRLLQTAAQGSGYLECQRCDFVAADGSLIVAQMTSNTTPSPVVVSASEEAFGTFAWQAFNRSTGARWHTNTPSTAEWLQVDLGVGNSARPAAICLAWNNGSTRFMPQFKVQGSDTAAWAGEEEDIWTSETWTAATWPQSAMIRVFVFDFDYSDPFIISGS